MQKAGQAKQQNNRRIEMFEMGGKGEEGDHYWKVKYIENAKR